MDNKEFRYTYTAPNEEERREIASIRRQYLSKEEAMTPVERLRELDARVKNLPMIVGLVLGVIGCLLFGLGMSMILVWDIVALGVIVAFLGCVPIALAYPAYHRLYEERRQTYAPEILRISEELLGQSNDAE